MKAVFPVLVSTTTNIIDDISVLYLGKTDKMCK